MESLHNIFTKKIFLNEISSYSYKKIKNWFAEAGINNLSFNELFGGKQRILLPFKGGGLKGEIGEIYDFFKKHGWDIDFSSGTAFRTIPFTIKKGEKKGKSIRKNEKMKVGKLLNVIKDAVEGTQKQTPNYSKKVNRLHYMFPFIDKYEFLPELFFGDKKEEDKRPKYKKWIEFWNTKAESYIRNPDLLAEEAKYTIILSRHPIDVLRMSDFSNITSCHTEGSQFFECALAEAKGHGPIAYVVKKEDLDKINLEDEEIFKDKERNVEGITPIARLRMRKFVHKEKEYELAIPEKSAYGERIPGFKNEMFNLLYKKQKHLFEDEIGKFNLKDFVRYGGSYEDNKDGSLFNTFFKTDRFSNNKNTDHILEDEDRITQQAIEWEQKRDELEEYASKNVRYWIIDSILRGGAAQEPLFMDYSSFSSYKFFNVNPDIEKNRTKSFYASKKIATSVKNILENDFSLDRINVYMNNKEIDISLTINKPPDMTNDPDGFAEFIDFIKEQVAPYYEKHKQQIKMFLVENEFILADEEAKLISKFHSNPYNKFKVKRQNSLDISINLKKPLVVSTYNDDIKFLANTDNFKGWFEHNFIRNLTNIAPPKFRIYQFFPGEFELLWHKQSYGIEMDLIVFVDDNIYNDLPSLETVASFFDFLDKNFDKFRDVVVNTFYQTKEEIIGAKNLNFENNLKNLIKQNLNAYFAS